MQSISSIHPLPSLASANWRIFTPCEESDSRMVFILKASDSFPGRSGYFMFVDCVCIKQPIEGKKIRLEIPLPSGRGY